MSNGQDRMNGKQPMAIYLLSIRGTRGPASLEEVRTIHNETAGAPASIAAAKSLGDLSHLVYVPAGGPGDTSGELLFLDLWNRLDGLNQFFANPQVGEQGGRIFATRDPVVWTPAAGFTNYHLPAPHGKNERIVALVRGLVASQAAAQATHNAILAGQINRARAAGALSHEAYFRLAPPDAPEALEFFAVDVWMDAAGMSQYYADAEFLRGFAALFTAPPATSVWAHPPGEWTEW